MRWHEETRHKGVTYKCDQCDFETQHRTSVMRHKKQIHSKTIIKTIIMCEMCNYSGKSKQGLKIHQRFVHEDVRFKCDLCDKKVKSLILHKRNTHKLQTREYMCNQCEFTTTARHSLSRHVEMIHEKVEYKCDSCGYKTNIKSNFQNHTKRHTDTFHCEQCSYTSKQKIHLDIHRKSKHEGELFVCNICDYKASQLSNLKRHQNSKHS